MEELQPSSEPPPLHVGIAFNLKKHIQSDIPDEEAEYDEMDTILAIRNALEGPGCHVTLLEATQDLPQKLADCPPDIVFNIAEGAAGRGREAQVPALLRFFSIPFSGSDETTLCIALDKALTKRILATHRITTPRFALVREGQGTLRSKLTYPVIVKPNAEGSSKGISNGSVATDADALRSILTAAMGRYNQEMLVEEFIQGREFTVGILGNGSQARVFSPMEIVFTNQTDGFNVYSFEVKKDFQKHVAYQCPADIPDALRLKMENTARRIFDILRCKDFARIDFRLSPEGRLYFIEINPLPGLAPGYSDYPMIAQHNGMDYNTLLRGILDAAVKRHGLQSCLR